MAVGTAFSLFFFPSINGFQLKFQNIPQHISHKEVKHSEYILTFPDEP